ncbi:uncharacterized protein LOC108917603 [Anoplophora glabripennis]|uniref:uncharacterized protein LOC108917603 n=1 Tax=Anoplophora glabripennis TaxID=217634 RepID=UPI00087553B7|nr:uncharacterized protein LOC108917603 [Anoplophora glabripennis]
MKMMLLLFLSLLFALALANQEVVQVDQEVIISALKQFEGTKFVLPKDLVEKLNSKVENNDFRANGITAVVDDYVDKVLVYIRSAILRSGLDPAKLDDATLNLIPTGTIDLTSGWLQDMSTIARDGSTTVGYDSSTKIMSVYLPIKLNALLATYKYHTKVLLLSIKGDVNGKIEDLRINVKLSFDYTTYQASLDLFDITDSGRISLKFTGNDLVDWITNTMTSVVSLFLHPIIIRIVQSIVKGGLESTVDEINELLNSILHSSTAVEVLL